MKHKFCPDEIIFSVTNKCNLKCPHCYVEQKNLSLDIEKAKFLNATFGLTSALEDDTGFDEIINKVIKKYIHDKGESTENQIFNNSAKFKISNTIKSVKGEAKSSKKKKKC